MYTSEPESITNSHGGVSTKASNEARTSSITDRSALLIEDLSSCHSNNKHSKTKWTTSHFLVILLTIAFTAIVSNMDRIVTYFIQLSSDDREKRNDDLPNTYDIIIVGGGATGVHTMHFLDQHENNVLNRTYKKLLIERLPHIGGNTFSHSLSYNNSKSNIWFEMGAMRFSRSDYYISRMMKRMNLCNDFISMDSNNGNNRYYYYRNEWGKFDVANNSNYWIPLYNFDARDENWLLNGPSLDTLNSRTRNKIYEENNNNNTPSTDEEWYAFRNNWTLQGIPLWDWSYEAYLKYYLNYSLEYFDYTEDRAGMFYRDRSLSAYLYNGPSLAPIPSPTPGQPDGLWSLVNGFVNLIKSILTNITSYENNDVWLGNELIGIDYNDPDEGYKYKLIIKDHLNDSNIKYAYSNHIVLAMNPLALQTQLPYFKPIDNEITKYIVNSVVVSELYKVNLIFDSQFMIDSQFFKSTVGSSTDLAIGSYLIESAWTDNELTALQIYATGDGSQLLHRLQGMGKPYPIHDLIDTDLSDGILVATIPVVRQVLNQIEIILSPLNWTSLPKPLAAFSQPLGTNVSNGDGIYQWRAGYKRDFVYQNIRQPNKNENIYIGSSSYSESRFFQYGAIWSAMQIVQNCFNVTYNPLQFDEYNCTL